MGLLGKYLQILPIKNKKLFSNEYMAGTPDIVMTDKVIDVKSSWDIFTFSNANGTNTDYKWQLWAYMWLTNTHQALLMYCLNNSPEYMIFSEFRKELYKSGLMDCEGTPEFVELEQIVRNNMTYDDIDWHEKIKSYTFIFDEIKKEIVIARIIEARIYLNTLETERQNIYNLLQ